MYLFLIVARVDGSDNDFSTYMRPARDEESAQNFVLADLTDTLDAEDKPNATLEIEVSCVVGQYVAQDALRLPRGTDWMLSNAEWAEVLVERSMQS
jgi:hypothetical protein